MTAMTRGQYRNTDAIQPVAVAASDAGYAKLLEIMLAACVGILVIPVTLQVISRYTPSSHLTSGRGDARSCLYGRS